MARSSHIVADYTGRVPISPAKNTTTRFRMLVCDIDGTLLNSQGRMTEATLAALHRARDTGMEVVFATGRRHSFACSVLEASGFIPNAVLISSNGAVTRTIAGERLHRTSMPVGTARLLCETLTVFRESLIFTFEQAGPGSMVVEDVEALHKRLPGWVDRNRHEIACCVPLEDAFQSSREPIQAMICGPVAEMRKARAFLDSPAADVLRDKIGVHRTEYVHRDLCVLDLLPVNCSKGAAVARLAAQRGWQAAEIACIGDNMNDADMLAFAGHPVVMQNAAADLLALAATHGWVVTGSNDEDGAAQAILRMLEGTSELDSSNPAPDDLAPVER
jgi:Cof subfamily protein (haloacid dehalogenase superfamily)